MTPSIVLFANQPRLLRELLRAALNPCQHLLIVEETPEPTRMLDIFHQVQVDWLVVSLDDAGLIPHDAHLLFNCVPSLSLMSISQDGSQVELRLKNSQQFVTRVSLQEIDLQLLSSILAYKLHDTHLPSAIANAHPVQELPPHTRLDGMADELTVYDPFVRLSGRTIKRSKPTNVQSKSETTPQHRGDRAWFSRAEAQA